ncbi:MAG: TolC family protein [Ignavibacteriaceae bacterium]
MNYKYFFISAYLIISVSFIKIYPQESLSLENAVKIALQNNYSINIAKNEKEISDNNYSLGNAGFLPQLDATGSYTKSSNNTSQEYLSGQNISRNSAKSSNLSGDITLNWTIFDGFQMFASLNQLKELRKQGEINFKIAVENNISDVVSTYYDIIRQIQVLAVIERSINISQERVRIAQDKKQLGSGSKFDLLQAQVDLNEDRSSLLTEELTLKQDKILLNRLLGRDVDFDFSITDTVIAINKNLSFEELSANIENRNSRLIQAKQNKNLAGINLQLARSGWYPEISVFAGYDYVHSESEAGFVKSNTNKSINYGINASLNIFDGLNTNRNIENAQVSIENSELSYTETKKIVDADLKNAFYAYKNSLTLVDLETENLKAADENSSIALERLRLGSIAPLDFRETQRKLIDAKSRLVGAQYEAKKAETQLFLLSGELIKSE